MEERKRSCADCGVIHCDVQNRAYPPFCLTTHMDSEAKAAAMARYDEGDNRRVMQTAAQVEYEGYLNWSRVRETAEFARRMGFHKLGIATCVGHDSLFYRYSEAMVTTLVTKDRVYGHNPVAALYTAGTYAKRKLYPEEGSV